MGSSLIYKHEDGALLKYCFVENVDGDLDSGRETRVQDGMNFAKCFERIIVGSCLQSPADVDTWLDKTKEPGLLC